MNIEIRLLKDDEKNEVIRLFNLTHPQQRSLEHFHWEFRDAPAGKGIYVVAYDIDAKKIVGTQAAIPVEMVSNNGERMLTAKSEDTLLDPAYRGKGLFDKMYQLLFDECRKQGIKYIWGFTYANKPFLKVGFEIPYKATSGLYVINPISSYNYLSKLNLQNKFMDKFKIFGLCWMGYFTSMNAGLFATKSSDNLSLTENLSFDRSKVIAAIGQTFKEKIWTINLTNEYINWRFRNNPHSNKFSFFGVKKNENIVGDIILNKRKEGFGYIEQLFLSDEITDTDQQVLINQAIKNLKSQDSFLIRFLGFDFNKANKSQIDSLKKCGFTFIDRGASFVWKRLTDVESEFINPNELLMSRSYSQGDV
jgi:GNAT superfamily N-acetyltransferase